MFTSLILIFFAFLFLKIENSYFKFVILKGSEVFDSQYVYNEQFLPEAPDHLNPIPGFSGVHHIVIEDNVTVARELTGGSLLRHLL